MNIMHESDLRRCMRIIAMSNPERIRIAMPVTADMAWFLEHIDSLAPELHQRGWVEERAFTQEPGAVTVTTGQGDVQQLVATPLGLSQLNAGVFGRRDIQ